MIDSRNRVLGSRIFLTRKGVLVALSRCSYTKDFPGCPLLAESVGEPKGLFALVSGLASSGLIPFEAEES